MNRTTSLSWFLLPVASVAAVAAAVTLTLALALPSEVLVDTAPELARVQLEGLEGKVADDRSEIARRDDARLPPGHPPVPGWEGAAEGSGAERCPYDGETRIQGACPHARSGPSCPGQGAPHADRTDTSEGRLFL